MVKKWMIVLGASFVAASSLGCAGGPGEGIPGEVEITGTTAQADDAGMWKSYGISGYQFTGSLNHVAPHSTFFGLHYGMAGAPQGHTIYSTTGQYNFGGLTPGSLYGFQAADCTGHLYGADAACGAYGGAINLYSPFPGTKWSLASDLSADQLAGAYPAGYYVDNGVHTSVPFCAGAHGANLYVGYFRDGACNFGVAGSVYTTQSAVVLTAPGQGAHFGPYGHGFFPPGAMIGGYADGHSLYGCQASCGGAVVPGWSQGAGCNVACDGLYHNVAQGASVLVSGGGLPVP